MYIDEFVSKMRDIKKMSFVESHRTGPTGIGKTLEDLLGITENNIAGPDFDIYELKSARRDSLSMLTLFTKVPQPKGANRLLLNSFGYKERKRNDIAKTKTSDIPIVNNIEKKLHTTINSISKDTFGFKLRI